ncbi:MAG TPA: EAL domain-containing protein [Motilibacteraceae bacterium]|nr:EAL domain-containing protein [Motilibacteraceae bacterium]
MPLARLEQRSAALRALHDVSTRIGASLDLTRTLDAVAAAVVESIGFRVAVVNLVEGDQLRVVAVSGGPEVREALAGRTDSVTNWTRLLELGEPWGSLRFLHHDVVMRAEGTDLYMHVPDLPVVDDPHAWHPFDALLAPLHGSDGELVGVISVDDPVDGRVPGALQRELLELFASQAAIAITNAGLYSRLREREASLAASLAEARRNEEQFRVLFASAPIGMVLVDEDAMIREVNEAACRMVGRRREEVLGAPALTFTRADDVPLVREGARRVGGGPVRLEKRYLHADGSVRWGEATLTRFRAARAAGGGAGGEAGGAADAGAPWLLVQIEDITHRREQEAELRHLATHDPLTGLANRSLLLSSLASRLRTASPSQPVGIVFVDLDRFKRVNDTWGHAAGDELLTLTAQRLRSLVRRDDVVGRLGGDEFAVLTCGHDRAGAAGLAERLRAALAEPAVVAGVPLTVTASVGLLVVETPDQDASAVLAGSDAAMYAGKQRGGNRVEAYDECVSGRVHRRGRTEGLLRAALADEGASVLVQYQPVVDVRSRAVTGMEALVRLVDEHGTVHPPGDFIDVAEDSGLIVPLGARVLSTALADAVAWQRPDRPVPLSVNVSGRQAVRPEFALELLDELHRSGLPPHLLALELTESVLLEAGESTVTQLHALRAAGVHLGVDDFGTGYASLTYLHRLPLTFVKVDRSFTAGLPHDPASRAIVAAVCGLAEALGLSCTVEGIETEEQLRVAAAQPVAKLHGQGWLFGRALSAPDALAFLAAQPPAPATTPVPVPTITFT